MFETNFTHSSSSALPNNISIEGAMTILHDFDTVMHFSPDVRGTRPVPAPNGSNKNTKMQANGTSSQSEEQWWEVEDDLPFIPKRLWSGGVKYNAIFVPKRDGCDITIMAPGGFTSVNHWRLVREGVSHEEQGLVRVKTKDLLHADQAGGGWYVQIVSEAKCNRTFAGFVKGFLKNSHVQLERSFIDRLEHDQSMSAAEEKFAGLSVQTVSSPGVEERPQMARRPTAGGRRPTLGRRRSTGMTGF